MRSMMFALLLPVSGLAACAVQPDEGRSADEKAASTAEGLSRTQGELSGTVLPITKPVAEAALPSISTTVNNGDYANTISVASASFATSWSGSPLFFYVAFDSSIIYQTSVAPPSSGSYTFTRDASQVAEGFHTVLSVAGNGYGQTMQEYKSVLVDRTTPRVTVSGPSPSLSFAISASDNYGISRLSVVIDNNQYNPVATYTNQSSATYTAPSSLPAGNHSLYVRAFDKAGNQAWSNTVNFPVIANRAPVFGPGTPASFASEEGYTCGAGMVYQPVKYHFTATDPDGDSVKFSLSSANGIVPSNFTLSTQGDFVWDGKPWPGANFRFSSKFGVSTAMTSLTVMADDGRGGRTSWPLSIALTEGPSPPCAPPPIDTSTETL